MNSSAKKTANQDTRQADPQLAQQVTDEPMHDVVLSPSDYTFLVSLSEKLSSSDRVRADMADLLMDDETLGSLRRYKDFFAFGGVDVDHAVEALPRAIRLKQLQRRLDLASALVQRHIVATSEPIVGVVSDVRRMVVATPKGSAFRDAFAMLDERWRDTFRGGRSPAQDDVPDVAPTPVVTPPK